MLCTVILLGYVSQASFKGFVIMSTKSGNAVPYGFGETIDATTFTFNATATYLDVTVASGSNCIAISSDILS